MLCKHFLVYIVCVCVFVCVLLTCLIFNRISRFCICDTKCIFICVYVMNAICTHTHVHHARTHACAVAYFLRCGKKNAVRVLKVDSREWYEFLRS